MTEGQTALFALFLAAFLFISIMVEAYWFAAIGGVVIFGIGFAIAKHRYDNQW